MARRSINRARQHPEGSADQDQVRTERDPPGEVELEWGADEDAEPYDEDDYGPGVYFYINDDDQPEEPPQSDLADAAYLDPLALVNAWEGALTDLKELHQERFLPPSEAPLTPTQKQAKAPFWYGPPASEASTSQLPRPPSTSTSTSTAALPSSFSAASLQARADSSAAAAESTDAPPTKKRKRLTGSQKKARKAAKLALGAGAGGGGAQGQDAEEDDDGPSYEPPSPPRQFAEEAYTPQSPELARAPLVPEAGPSQPAPPRAALASPPAPPIGARPSSSSSGGGGAERAFVIPPVASLPSTFPPPPTITPLTGREAPLDAETPEQLLEAALWSWFTAGYQTALLHAAAGVARFAPSAGEGGAAQE
ncbi:hypothetical protein JCM10450v2_006368 [Rhodotorula kratochvilovae]